MINAFRISTGFYIWDVYKWLLVFMLSLFLVWLAVSLAVTRKGGWIFPESEKEMPQKSRRLPIERALTYFTRNFIEPWESIPVCGLLGIAGLTLLFVTAIFLR
ncbi:MAG: hypothetical protein HUJ86_03275 [Synergistes sp.]|nr:hypothetical protein [Synergistes sp.]